MAKPKTDPLIGALIEKLPKGGDEWPVDRQLAWLKMMAMAFGEVYGGDVAAHFAGSIATQASTNQVLQHAPMPKFAPKIGHPFLIDEDGVIRRASSNDRVLPGDVTGSVFDMRGVDGDLRTIVWADDSVGLNGKDLLIHS